MISTGSLGAPGMGDLDGGGAQEAGAAQDEDLLGSGLGSTFLHLQQGSIVERAFTGTAARIDLWVNVLTLVAQVLLTGRLITALGVPVGLASVGCSGLWWASSLALGHRVRLGG